MIALITGASSGIGKEMAKNLATRGVNLILVARRTERLLALKEEIVYNCPEIKVKTITADLSKEEQCFELYDRVKEYKIDFLFNNAGFGLYGPFLETDLKDELSMINVNIKAVHILTKLFLRDFAARNSGYILNTASVAGFMAGPLLATYYATKKLCRTAYQGDLRGTEKHRQQGSDKRTLPRTCRYRIQQRCRRKELRNTERERGLCCGLCYRASFMRRSADNPRRYHQGGCGRLKICSDKIPSQNGKNVTGAEEQIKI